MYMPIYLAFQELCNDVKKLLALAHEKKDMSLIFNEKALNTAPVRLASIDQNV